MFKMVSHMPPVKRPNIWVKYQPLHAQLSHNLGQFGIGMPFTHSIRELACVQPYGADTAFIHSIRCVFG